MYSSDKYSVKHLSMDAIIVSIDELMELRAILRRYSPDFDIEEESDRKLIFKKLKKISKNLVPIFKDLGFCGETVSEIPSGDISEGKPGGESKGKESLSKDGSRVISSIVALMDILEDGYLFVSSNSLRDKLKKSGIPPNKIISSGGPISIEDLKEKNPNIPEKALQGYQKKIDSLAKKLSSIADRGDKLYFAWCPMEESDNLVYRRLKEFEEKIGTEFSVITVKNWDDILK